MHITEKAVKLTTELGARGGFVTLRTRWMEPFGMWLYLDKLTKRRSREGFEILPERNPLRIYRDLQKTWNLAVPAKLAGVLVYLVETLQWPRSCVV